jgi:ribonuclease HI
MGCSRRVLTTAFRRRQPSRPQLKPEPLERGWSDMSDVPRIIVDATCKIPDAHKKGRAGIGKAACGVLIIDKNGQEYEYSLYLGEKTVPQAEFEGLVFALDKASEIIRRNQYVEVWMDSELVVKWMNKDYRLKKEHIKPLFDKANDLAQRFEGIKYFHHSREARLAKRADGLAQAKYEEHNT